jgi:aminopeptidase N
MPNKVTRLYEQFQPKKYDLLLDIDPEKLTFKGTVIISGKKVGRPAKRLTFHQKDLTITAASIVRHTKTGIENISVSRINSQKSFNEVRLHSEEMIFPGDYSVTIEYSGSISKAMHGIYPCFYKHDGKDKKLIASQFESHHAREAFPVIDEPEAKATFNLSLITPTGLVALANTPIKEQTDQDGKLVTKFEPSPIMSAYLLAFVFGEMHAVSGESSHGIKVSSYATVAQPTSHLEYANSEAIKILDFFIDYFKTDFPLPKLDQVALPDFEALAMENWGLITFREVGLLADPVNRSLSGEQLITLVIAHEVSHQWFGDLVTMKWWDDLWLNESFASIMENIAPDKLHPDWNQWEDFATSRVLSCSHRDIYKDVQAVGVDVNHPDDISSLFDPAIVYAKGARLLTMLYDYMGEDDFRSGLQTYFNAHAFSNTTRHDLWQSLSKASNKDLDKLMTPWIEQPGQPKLSVKRENNKLKLSQERFLMDGEDDTLWPIPLLSDKKLQIDVLTKKSVEFDYSENSSPIFNLRGSGHYIVSYENKEDRDNVSKKISDRSVDAIARITLLNDMLLLSRMNEFKLEDMLSLIINCSDEPRDAVWSMFSRIIGQAQTLTDGNKEVEAPIRNYKAKLAKTWYDKLGWDDKEDDEPNTKHLRSTAIAFMLAGEDEAATKSALDKFKAAGSVEALPAEQRAMIAAVAVRKGDSGVVDQLMKEYVDSPNPDVQQAITSALCATRDKAVGQKIIDWGLKDHDIIRQQDIDHWFAYLMRNHYTRDLVWDWFVNSWDDLTELIGGGKHMEYYVWYAAGALSTPEWQAKFIDFFEPKKSIQSIKRNITIALSEIDVRVKWRQSVEPDLVAFFKQYSH